MSKLPRYLLLLLLLAALPAGCAPDATVETGPPEGWQGEGARWWRQGLDTTGVFRNLETLAGMGVTNTQTTYLASPQQARQLAGVRQQFERAVKQRLLPLYRNRPELVDSLFERYLTPTLDDALTTGALGPQVDRFQRKAYTLLRKHFQEPQTLPLQLGKDIPVPYPDSLRRYDGPVRTQVYLNEAGEPLALELLEGIHPVLDDVALRATTQMRWRPAYRMRNGRWVAIPAWTRFTVRFKAEG